MAPDAPGRGPTTEPASAPYTPFPAFGTWRQTSLDLSTVDGFFDSLDEARSELGPDAIRAAVEVATKWAAVDTGAIEGLYEVDRGFTYSVALEAAAWEAIGETRGEPVKRAIDDAVAAYELVLGAATRSVPVSEKWIRELHATICRSVTSYRVRTAVGPQDHPLVPGRYKTEPNNPTRNDGSVFAFAPVDDTAPEMARLVDELRSPAFERAHPVEQAAYAHYAFVRVHPFADGNGRVARALASAFLYRRPGIPLVVFADQRAQYLDALEAADAGRYATFTRFLAQRVIDTIDLVRLQARTRDASHAAEVVATLRDALATPADAPSDVETAAIGRRVIEAILTEFEAQWTDLDVPEEITLSRSTWPRVGFNPPPGYLRLHTSISAWITVDAGRGRSVRRIYAPFASASRSEPRMVVTPASVDAALWLNLRDVYPVLTEVFTIKARTWVKHELSTSLDDVLRQLKAHDDGTPR